MEVARRAGGNASARFTPLFRAGWRSYGQLDEMLPEQCSGAEAETTIVSLALSFNVLGSGTISEAMVDAVCEWDLLGGEDERWVLFGGIPLV